MGKKKPVAVDDDEYALPDENPNGIDPSINDEDSASAVPAKKNKKGSKKQQKNTAVATTDEAMDPAPSVEAEHDVDEEIQLVFSGKKKSSKSKKSQSVFTRVLSALSEEGNDEPDSVDPEPEPELKSKEPKEDSRDAAAEEAVDASKKQKKKKKKSGKAVQEEDDLEKILAELGEGPSAQASSVPPPATPLHVKDPVIPAEHEKPESVEVNEEDVGGGGPKSAAAKKKQKKKEKEKEKKAAAAEAKEGKEEVAVKVGVDNKKLPKHVREMQEAMARRKEAEERARKAEEERLRKEEEERLRQEEEERRKEEEKRKRKEREKEKRLKKKQEGKILTGKQKEEERRRAMMRNQFLASGVEIPIADGDVKKRPKYETRKSRSNAKVAEEAQHETESVTQEEEVEEEGQVEEMGMEEQLELDGGEEKEEVMEVEEEEEEENWDEKSWDDVDVGLHGTSTFGEEEDKKEDEKVRPEPKKKSPPPTSSSAETLKCSAAVPAKPAAKKAGASHPPHLKGEKEAKLEAEAKGGKKKGAAPEDISQKSESDLRSPICCILGHVDTGKTKLLDCIRGTNVQEGEAGGITQQIGATYFPMENIRERTKQLKADAKLKVPGLLVIDTPGHESFTNLRSRGSGLCDIAILVVDIMHGLEPQTKESINLLKSRNTEFIVALNKVDRLYGWKTCRNAPILTAMKEQSKDVQNEFKMRVSKIITEFMEQGLNTELYYKNKEMGETSSIVPTSAISGEGIPDLLLLLVQWAQRTMVEKLTFHKELQCTVLEVKVIEGLGTTIDVVLVNGVLHEGDQIVVCGMQGPIVTNIRALLTPHPMKELRVKGSYQHHKELKAAQGIKITAQGLEQAVAGTALYVVGPDDDVEDVKETAMQDMKSVMSRIDKSGDGIAKVGTLICIPSRDFIDIGRIASIEINHKHVDVAKKGQKVAIKILGSNSEEQQKMFGRHFEIDDELVSHISRKSIDVLKMNYREDLTLEEWQLVVKLKKLFKIP
ncbi:hypothetical protein QJS10_CPB11g02132 [Acorus calamus]|uniref:Tr-type G domain-containing protein n=1 Tax=Acorus calamus TaxID=4465 RepID=A0AAV9DQN6_ACOCL|nr:hypothetical protein QJS10_CPB11g02132 [Acorus calamus]